MPPRQLRLHTLRLSALPFFRSLLERASMIASVSWSTGHGLRELYDVYGATLDFLEAYRRDIADCVGNITIPTLLPVTDP